MKLTELVQGCVYLRDGEGAELCKDIPVQAWTGRKDSRRLRFPGDTDSWNMKVARSALRTGRFYRQENSLVLISVTG